MIAGKHDWYKDAVIYEVRIRSFFDGDGDGIGDISGLTQKLDYLADLGITAIWLLPFYPSPLRDDGYDISDYTDVHPSSGTLDEFRRFLVEAHRRGLRVITELVLNHTSDQHPWFQRARRSPPGSPERAFYVWSDSGTEYAEARVIFKDFEVSNWSWDPLAKAYFWHRFYSHQPDLNFENPAVRAALLGLVDFWLEMGVDGLRLDAVPYLFEREGTSCENLPETHAFLRELRAHVDARFSDRMLLAEANQWPEDAVAYFGHADECHMAFHFPIMPRIFMAIHMEDRFPIIDILAQTPELQEGCQWALFLRNHDELTLEMVTDEERDYMVRAYAKDPTMRVNLGIRRRLAPLLDNDRRNIELMNALLLSLPGTPVLYYGDEIGMGDNVFLGDRNGVRTPMQWSADKNAGFSRANPQRLILPVIFDPEYHYEAINVEAQQNNPTSLLWWTKRVIALRKRFAAFGRGTIEFLRPENPRVLAFLRRYEAQTILVVANLSRFGQFVELDLSRCKGLVPNELFGGAELPVIGEAPYLLTLGGHDFYWFSLEAPKRAEDAAALAYHPPMLDVAARWQELLAGDGAVLARALAGYFAGRRWYEGRARRVSGAAIVEVVAASEGARDPHLLIVRVDYAEGDPEQYFVPIVYETGDRASALRHRSPQAVVAEVHVNAPSEADPGGLIVDALADDAGCEALIELIARRARLPGRVGEIVAGGTTSPEAIRAEVPRLLRQEHGGSAVLFGDRFFMKLRRKLDDGRSPDLELAWFLAGRTPAVRTPEVCGYIEHRRRHVEPVTLAVLRAAIASDGDGRKYALEELARTFERVLTKGRDTAPPPLADRSPLLLAGHEPPAAAREPMGAFLDVAALMGTRAAELHLALASDAGDPAFAPEPHTVFDQRSLYQSMRNSVGKATRALRTRGKRLPPGQAELAARILEDEAAIDARFTPLLGRRLASLRTRIHGSLTLGRFLHAGRDVVIAELEGDRSRPLVERRRKASPLRDVASMVRSLHDAAWTALLDEARVRPEDRAALEPWADLWAAWSSAAFVRSYLATAGGAAFLPRDAAETALLLDAFFLEGALACVIAALRDGERVEVALRVLCSAAEVEPAPPSAV